jgi:1,4-alpha-glucan branching enzyme
VQAAAEARAKAIALADEVKRKEEEEKRAKEEAKRAAEEAEKRAKEEEEAARLRAEEEAMERELAEIAAAQAQALAEIEARQNADQAELEAKAQAKADKNAAAAAERAAAAQAQAEADAAIAAAEADALSVPGSSTASDASAPPAAPSEVPVDLTANATEEDIAARTTRLGANVTSIGCAFGVWAPHAEKMTLLIYGGAPDPLRGYDASAPLPVPARYDMYRDPNNNANWRMEVQQVGAGWRYAFEVTMPGGHTFTRRDPWARETDFDSDVCFVVDPAQFRWSKFDRPQHDELVMYQCHVGTFTGRGDPELGTSPGTFVALTRKLDHIKNLGFNCLQLLPHTEFGGAWGYNPRLMHAVHGPYGDSLEFAELVDAAHKRGIAVMVDVALHHGAANGNSLWEFDGWSQDGDGGIYFERAGDTGWGQGFAFWKEEVQEYLSATVDTWLGEYNCDGVRIDSAHSMPPDFVRRVTNRAHKHEGRFVVVEHSPEGGHVPGELGADACWLFSSCDNCAGMTNYWKGNMERLEQVARAPEGYHSNSSFVKFPLGSHDVIGKRPGHTHDLGHWASRFGGRGEWRARASMRLWWGVAAAGVGIPMMFMGTETHQDGHWHVEPEAEMDWSTIARGGEKWAKEGMELVKAANEMRTKHWSLTRGTARVLHKDHENGIIVIERHYEGVAEDGKTKMNERLIVVVNDGDGQWDAEGAYGVNVGPSWGDEFGRFEEIFNSQDEAFGGWPGSGNAERGVIEQQGDMLPLAIPKLGVVVLKQVSGPSRDPDLVLAELSAGAAASISALGR